jgi:REP element-mobilizing transposase RayT
MAVRSSVSEPGIYFITFTCFNWKPLIELTNSYDVIYNFFEVLRSKGNSICGYVVMPNHVHFLMHYDVQQKLNTIIGNGKRFAAYEIVKRLKEKREFAILKELSDAVEDTDHKRGKLHEVWMDSFDVKQCRTESFIEQKLHYMHRNPLTGKWNLCRESIDYSHSSARFYFNGTKTIVDVVDYRIILAKSV